MVCLSQYLKLILHKLVQGWMIDVCLEHYFHRALSHAQRVSAFENLPKSTFAE